MSDKYHIGKNGPAKCTAQDGNCPLGGVHGDREEIEQAFSEQQGGNAPQVLKKNSNEKTTQADKFIDDHLAVEKYSQRLFIDAGPYDYLKVSSEEWGVAARKHTDEFNKNLNEFHSLKDREKLLRNSFGEGYKTKKELAEKYPESKIFQTDFHKANAHRQKFSEEQIEKEYNEVSQKIDPVWKKVVRSELNKEYSVRAAVLSKTRIVDGVEVKPGEGVFNAIYSTDGQLLSIDRSTGFTSGKTKTPDGSLFKYRASNAEDPEKRYESNYKRGFMIGTVVAPARINKESKVDGPAQGSKDFAKIRPTKNIGQDPKTTPRLRLAAGETPWAESV